MVNKENNKLYEIAQICMNGYDYLEPLVFDEKEKLRDEVREKLIEVGNLIEHKLRHVAPDLIIDDVVLQGEITSYIREEKCDIALQLICHSPSTPDVNLDAIMNATIGYFYNSKNLHLHFQDKEIAYLAISKLIGTYSGVYSVKNNKWISKPIKKAFTFSTDDLYEMSKQRMLSHEDFINTIPRNEKGELSLESCKKINHFIKDMPKYFMNKAANGNKEYEMEFQIFRVLKKRGEMRNLRKFYTTSVKKIVSVV